MSSRDRPGERWIITTRPKADATSTGGGSPLGLVRRQQRADSRALVREEVPVQAAPSEATVELNWLPLGAGNRSVQVNGRVFEAVEAFGQRRPAGDLYHSALEIRVPEGRFIIEQAPVPDSRGASRGVVAEGPVGTRWAGRFRVFRYEVRCWRDGLIPDIDEAVDSPRRLSRELVHARRIIEVAPSLPTPVWGRDELKAGEMWNSNSVIAWLVARSGLDADSIRPPAGGRAPGWRAGLSVARRVR